MRILLGILNKFHVVLKGGRAVGEAYADLGSRTHLSDSGNMLKPHKGVITSTRLSFHHGSLLFGSTRM
jgi:hypothetical protein